MPQSSDNTTREWQWLCLAMRLPLDEAAAAQLHTLAAQGINADELTGLAIYHGVAPLLAHHLHRHFPALLTRRLEVYVQHNSIRAQLLAQTLGEMLTALSEAGVKAVPFKGPTLALQAFGALELREFCDLDVLVRPQQLAAVERVCLAHGFKDKNPYPPARKRDLLRFRYDHPMTRSSDGTLLEIHWRWTLPYAGIKFEGLQWWETLMEVAHNGRALQVLAPAETLLFLCVHGSKDGWDKLKLLADIAQFLRAFPAFDWSRFWQVARLVQAEHLSRIALRLADEILQAPLPATLQMDLREDASLVPPMDYGRKLLLTRRNYTETMLARHTYFIKAQTRWWQKLRYIWGFTVTPGSTEWYYVALPAALSFVYRWLRIARLTKFYSKRWLKAALGVQK